MVERVSQDDPRIVRDKQRGIVRREPTLEDELPKIQQRLGLIEQYVTDHNKLHEELAERAGEVEEVRVVAQAQAHMEMMAVLRELMAMMAALVAARGTPLNDDVRIIEQPQQEFTFEIERRADGLMQRVIARPKID